MKNDKQSIFALVFFALFSLGLTTTCVASQVEEQSIASAQTVDSTTQLLEVLNGYNEVDVGVVKKLLAEGADLQRIRRLNQLPSLELSALLIEKGLEPTKYLDLVMSVYIGSDGQAKLAELVELALEKGADPRKIEHFGYLPSLKLSALLIEKGLESTKFLNLVMAAYVCSDYEQYRQIELVKFVFEKGADARKIEHFGCLPSLELSALLIEKGLEPTKLLDLLMSTNVSADSQGKRDGLVKWVLEKGADPNGVVEVWENRHILQLIIARPKLIKILIDSNYKKLDPKVICDAIERFSKKEKSYYEVNKLNKLLEDPSFVFAMKYKNLDAERAVTPKIPRILHHIWLTNSQQKKEISAKDLENVQQTHEIFSHNTKGEWQHIVWTNDKNLIPESVKKLEAMGVVVREMSEVKNCLRLDKKVYELIEQGRWGMASDTLRYDLVNCLGGVYADLNYEFKKNVEDEIYKNDYFAQTYQSDNIYFFGVYLFGSKAHHPILIKLLDLVNRNFNNPPEYIIGFDRNKRKITDYTTAICPSIAYYTSANNGTIDVVYPHIDSDYLNHSYDNLKEVSENKNLEKIFTEVGVNCDSNMILMIEKIHNYIDNNEICGIPEQHLIGRDGKNGLSWINPEWDR